MCETVALAHGAKSATRDIWRPTKRRTAEQSPEEMEAEFAKIEAFLRASQKQKD